MEVIGVLDIGVITVVGDNTVSTAKLGDNAVSSVKIQDSAITSAKILDGTIANADINASAAIANSKMASDTTDASNISSGALGSARMGSGTASATTVLYGDGTWKAEPVTDVSGLKEDIALIAFKTQANGNSLAKYGLVDQVVDSFEDTSGIDLSGSTNEIRNLGNYIIGGTAGSDTVTKLTSGTSWTVPAGVYNAEVLVVAGGGGGGTGGGGGAGGVVHDTNHILTAAASVTYAIGAAGTGGTYTSNTNINGGNTTFGTLTGIGGGGGGCRGMPTAGTWGQDGGSGGGADYSGMVPGNSTQQTAGTPTGGTITAYGNPGGYARSGNPYMEGGGGGSGGGGQPPQWPTYSGQGGRGILWQFVYDFDGASSNNGWLAAGGAGSYHHSFGGSYGEPGQNGGGRAGDASGAAGAPTSYGSGGGGADTQASSTGGAGIQGAIYVKYTPITEAALTLVSTSTEAESAPTKGDVVMTYSDGVGTTSLNTDLTAEISADDGSTWTPVTLALQGTSGGHTIVTANQVTITSTISTPADMRYRIKTINQSASKQTRVHAVSLGWS